MWHDHKWLTQRELVARGARIGTFRSPDATTDTVHGYVWIRTGYHDLPVRYNTACGIYGLWYWDMFYPESAAFDTYREITCKRCAKILGERD